MDKQFIVDNLGYRLGVYHRNAEIQIGVGNPNARVLVIQPTSKMPERDAVTGALKKFGMLGDSYRATTEIVSGGENNRYYLKELIQIIKPLVVVACGAEVTALLKGNEVKSFSRCSGKKFRVQDMPEYVFYSTVNPMDYGFARAPQRLKDKGKEEWSRLEEIFHELKEKQEKERWM